MKNKERKATETWEHREKNGKEQGNKDPPWDTLQRFKPFVLFKNIH